MTDIKKILRQVAGIALPIGASVLNAETGGVLKPLTDRLLETLGAAIPDPAVRAQMERAAQEHSAELEKVELEYAAQVAAIAQKDRASAREREVSVRDETPHRLAFLMVAFFCLYSLSLLAMPLVERYGIKPDGALLATIGTVLGYAIGEVKTVFNYYFGSSSGSATKTDIISDIAKSK